MNKLWTLLASALLVAGARADTLGLKDSGFVPSALKGSRKIYSYVPRLQRRESWADKQMRDMRNRRAARRNRAAAAVYTDRMAQAHRSQQQRGTAPNLSGTPLAVFTTMNSMADVPGTDAVPLTGVSGGTAGMAIDFIATDVELAQMAGVPDSAISMATTLIDFTDKATAAALSLQGVLARQLDFDWTAIFRTGIATPDVPDMFEKSRRRGGGKAASDEDKAHVAVAKKRRAVRSAMNIILGILIGVALWLIARRL